MSENPKDSSTPEPSKSVNQTQETIMLQGAHSDQPTTPPHMSETVRVNIPRQPTQKAKYELIKELGKGGFAWVYLVRNLDLNRLEAIKILNADLTMEEDICNRFVKEAQISANFNHQNIVTIYEVQREGYWSNFKADPHISNRHAEPFVYFTMSFVEGNTSTNLIRKSSRMPQKEALRIVMDACSALDYAHGIGVIHRDIKPDNIIVDRRGRGIVMDFGIAKVVDQTRQTAAGTFMGTARYVSPEQALGKEIDGRSDLYSLGITLYELVTGRVPFDSEEWMTVLYAHVNQPPPAPERFFAEIDRDLRAVILKMLEKKPEHRFQTARETHDALAHVFQKLGGPAVHTEAIDKIGTRPDLMPAGIGTQATEVARTRVKAPPQRPRTAAEPVVVSTPATPTPESGKIWVKALTLIAILAVAGFAIWKFLPKDTNPPPLPILKESHLLVTAFPRGRLVRIVNEDLPDQPVEANLGELPLRMQLPQGNYELIVEYEGQTKKKSVFLSPDIAQSKAHLEFAVEDERFLLEDLR